MACSRLRKCRNARQNSPARDDVVRSAATGTALKARKASILADCIVTMPSASSENGSIKIVTPEDRSRLTREF